MIRYATPPKDAKGACGPTALACVTDYSANDWLELIRRRRPWACTGRHGVTTDDITWALETAGLEYTRVPCTPHSLHLALKLTHGQRAIICGLVGRGARQYGHAIAAEGFIIADTCNPTPRWYADAEWPRTRRVSQFRVIEIILIGPLTERVKSAIVL